MRARKRSLGGTIRRDAAPSFTYSDKGMPQEKMAISLQSLWLNRCEVDNQAAISLASALEANTSLVLTQLRLRENSFTRYLGVVLKMSGVPRIGYLTSLYAGCMLTYCRILFVAASWERARCLMSSSRRWRKATAT